MATIAERRAALVTALDSGNVEADVVLGKRPPPYVAVLGDGIASDHVVRGEVLAAFRLACIAGAWDDAAAVAQLDALKAAALTAARGLAGYQMGALSRDGIRRIGGSDYLVADLIVFAYVTI